MVYVAEISQSKNLGISQCFQNKNLLYLQPSTRRPIKYGSYRKPAIKIESDTTYGGSYVKFDCVPRRRFNYGDHDQIVSKITKKMNFDTVYKLSYQALQGKVPDPFLPKSRLSMEGLQDMTTTHITSYTDPGHVKVKRYKPYRGKCLHSVPMEDKTVTKESYPNFDTFIAIKRPKKAMFWQTKSKTDYQTMNQLSYQYIGSIPTRIHMIPKRSNISAQMENDTIFKTSYTVPGRFIIKENIVHE